MMDPGNPSYPRDLPGQACPHAERDTVTDYLAGRLDPSAAKELEEHYFGCDACWREVQLASEVQAAFESDAVPGNVKDRSERSTPSGTARLFRLSKTRSHLAWWPLAAAALLAIVFLIRAPRLFAPIEEPGEPVMRGDETPLVAHATLVDGAIEIAWTAPENTDVSQVQLFTASGETLFDSESRGLRLVVLPGEMRDPRPEEPLFARITALDRARRVLARSGLIAVAAPPSSKP